MNNLKSVVVNMLERGYIASVVDMATYHPYPSMDAVETVLAKWESLATEGCEPAVFFGNGEVGEQLDWTQSVGFVGYDESGELIIEGIG